MSWSVDEYLKLPRETSREKELMRHLRSLGENEKEAFVWEFIEKSGSYGLVFAKSCCRRNDFFVKILRKGFREADANQIRWWMDCVIPKIGFRHFLSELCETLCQDISVMERVNYWIPGFLDRNNKKDNEAYRNLLEKARILGFKEGGEAFPQITSMKTD